MNTQTLETESAKVAPYNDVAALIDREVHAKTLEQINVLAREYEIRNPSKVAEFLSKNLFLLDLLKEIPAQIHSFFGENQSLKLEFFLDPEDASWHRLRIKIPTKLSVDESMLSLSKFDENWWLENDSKANSKITVRLEYSK